MRLAPSLIFVLAVFALTSGLPAVDFALAGEPDPGGPVEARVPAKGYRLRYQFDPNQLVYYEVRHKFTQINKTEEVTETTQYETRSWKHYRVISVDGERAGLLELVIDRFKAKITFGENEPISFDSQSSEPVPRPFLAVKQLIGRPRARMRFNSSGELLKATSLTRPRNASTGQLGFAPPTPDTDPTHNFLVVFPDRDLAVGESWSDRITVQVRINKSLLRPVTLMRKYKLLSVDGPRARIHLQTVVLTPIRDADIRTQLIQRTPAGTIVFDLEQGLIVSKSLDVNKRQVGAFGGTSSMQVVSRRSEKLLAPTDVAAAEESTRK